VVVVVKEDLPLLSAAAMLFVVYTEANSEYIVL
jgi:hypothetical protein